mmetsp:Transcript_33944/g.81611  ORF Transcript_33944/g.81611 Transcript_33944/m.81611 type:complete len:165 (-) Transcript_33944:236-730(-)
MASSSSILQSFSESLVPPEDERKPNVDYTTVSVEIKMLLQKAETSSSSTKTSPATTKPSYDVKLSLWLNDQRLACASAALVESRTAQLVPEDSSPIAATTVVVFAPIDKLRTVTQVGKTYDQMVEPSMYISIDVTESHVSYAKGSSPAFRLRLGDVGKIDVVPK